MIARNCSRSCSVVTVAEVQGLLPYEDYTSFSVQAITEDGSV